MTDSYLVADIGGTHARFAITDGERSLSVCKLATKELGAGADFTRVLGENLDLTSVTAGCVAIAGPVRGGEGRITNGELTLSEATLSASLGFDILLINDFVALAHSVPHAQQLAQIGSGAVAPGAKVVIGPGTGLGVAALVPVNGAWRVLASEAGYTDITASSPLEMEVLGVLLAQHPHVFWELVLSGPGIVQLYRALSDVWGTPADDVDAQWITEQAVAVTSPLCHQTLELFFGMLGSVAGNLALTYLAHGGVYIGGGIVPQLVEFARSSPMRRRFEERGPVSHLVADIPLMVMMDEDPGLTGARHALSRKRLLTAVGVC